MLSIQALQSPRLESADFVLLSLTVISQKISPDHEALAMLEAIVAISGEAHAPEEAITVDEVFTAMRTLGEDRPEIERVIKAIGRESAKYQAKDRGGKKTEISSSCTHGIMRSTDPLPRDEYLDAPRAGRVVDSFAIKPALPGVEGFSRQRPSTPFVNSISGTAFTFVHFLLAFIHENVHDTNLQV